jgi:hypothetical protein
VAQQRQLWLRATLAYTIAGSISASVAGAAVGLAGALAGDVRGLAVVAALALVILLSARDGELVTFRLPQRRRQTEKRWLDQFGYVMASTMWGLHIGLGFATFVKFGGFWALTATVFAFGSPGFAAACFVAYWAGRALPVWLAPRVMNSRYDGFDCIGANETYRRAAVAGLLCVMGTLVAHIWA